MPPDVDHDSESLVDEGSPLMNAGTNSGATSPNANRRWFGREESPPAIQLKTYNLRHLYQSLDGDDDETKRKKKTCRLGALALLIVLTGIGIGGLFYTLKFRNEGGSTVHSKLDPVTDLGLADFDSRPTGSKPKDVITRVGGQMAYPTNAWYQNLLMLDDEPTDDHRAYACPYIVDANGPVVGLRIHLAQVSASTTVIQLNVNAQNALTIGAGTDVAEQGKHVKLQPRAYHVQKMTPLGVTLKWDSFPMTAPIAKGMPFATMEYEKITDLDQSGKTMLPTIASYIALSTNPVIDGESKMKCATSEGDVPQTFLVNREIELRFFQSDFTWLVFVSEPVWMQCVEDEGQFKLQVTGWADKQDHDERRLVIRAALLTLCTAGRNPIFCHQEVMNPLALLPGQGIYGDVIRARAHLYPGHDTAFSYTVHKEQMNATLHFDWNVQDMTTDRSVRYKTNQTNVDLAVYALPHHMDLFGDDAPIDGSGGLYCFQALPGQTCLVQGGIWNLQEELPRVSFRAPRPPAPWSIGQLAGSLTADIHYNLPIFFQKGAGDTYFSGKMLAKLSRIILIADEVREICEDAGKKGGYSDYADACARVSLPSDDDIAEAVVNLRQSVEIWLNGSAVVPFVYDSSWGGVVYCGCIMNEDLDGCANEFPDCPGFTDPGLNFGNAYYNDVHFHYGYHIFAASVVSYLDPDWGRRHFEQVMLLVRSIANPDESDTYFTLWRHKDWFNGHSWASGIATHVSNGRNQESSSEAIAAYEGVALYGQVMSQVWKEEGFSEKARVADEVYNSGQVMLATEIRSTRRYWHVHHKDPSLKTYPVAYTPHVIGMMWQTMAQFQTWFGGASYFAYGIQLLPLTPIAEQRDGTEWAKALYPTFAASCQSSQQCNESGWAILQFAVLATVGHAQLAAARTRGLPSSVFVDAGGNGHSLSNTIWYFATRPVIADPPSLEELRSGGSNGGATVHPNHSEGELTDCYRPETCTEFELGTVADLYTCQQRIQWLMDWRGKSQEDACYEVAGIQFPNECGECNPRGDTSTQPTIRCPPCTEEQCNYFNRCPRYPRTYVCVDGPSYDGCASRPWNLFSPQCDTCCELTQCSSSGSEAGLRSVIVP